MKHNIIFLPELRRRYKHRLPRERGDTLRKGNAEEELFDLKFFCFKMIYKTVFTLKTVFVSSKQYFKLYIMEALYYGSKMLIF